MATFRNFQIFSQKKSNIFTEPMICCSNAGLTRKSGAKKRQYFGFCKFSSNYFRHFFAHFSHPVRYQSFMLENIFYPSNAIPYNIYRYGYNASAALSLYVLLRLNTNNGANPIARLAPFVSIQQSNKQSSSRCLYCVRIF